MWDVWMCVCVCVCTHVEECEDVVRFAGRVCAVYACMVCGVVSKWIMQYPNTHTQPN
jgi:hypothetical protein